MDKATAPPINDTIADTIAPPRNFTLSLEERLRAYAQGAPSYIRRRRHIEDLQDRLVAQVRAARVPAEALEEATIVADLARLNELIANHNRYYAIEANLPVDIRTGRLLERGVPWTPLAAVAAGDLLALAAAK